MKTRNKIFILFTLILVIPFSLQSQSGKQKFKNFSDTEFKAGDLLLVPDISFYFDSCGVHEKSMDSIKIIADFLKIHSSFKVEIAVHSSMRGSEKYNNKMTMCRAEEIKKILLNSFSVDSGRIIPKGYGKSQPVETEKDTRLTTSHRKDPNSRVEIRIIKVWLEYKLYLFILCGLKFIKFSNK